MIHDDAIVADKHQQRLKQTKANPNRSGSIAEWGQRDQFRDFRAQVTRAASGRDDSV